MWVQKIILFYIYCFILFWNKISWLICEEDWWYIYICEQISVPQNEITKVTFGNFWCQLWPIKSLKVITPILTIGIKENTLKIRLVIDSSDNWNHGVKPQPKNLQTEANAENRCQSHLTESRSYGSCQVLNVLWQALEAVYRLVWGWEIPGGLS